MLKEAVLSSVEVFYKTTVHLHFGDSLLFIQL